MPKKLEEAKLELTRLSERLSTKCKSWEDQHGLNMDKGSMYWQARKVLETLKESANCSQCCTAKTRSTKTV